MAHWKTLAVRIVLGVVFLLAGLSKAGDPLRVLASVYSYQVPVPDVLARVVAQGLPALESLLGLLLLAGLLLRWSALLAGALLSAFLVLSAQAWWRALPIECGCIDLGGIHPALAFLSTPAGATLRNLVLLAFAVALVRASLRSDVEKNVNSP